MALANDEIIGTTARPDPQRYLGTVIAITGSRATLQLDRDVFKNHSDTNSNPMIGTMLSIDTGKSVALGLITSMELSGSAGDGSASGTGMVQLELIGELLRENDGYLKTCRRGVSVYPRLGDKVSLASRQVLQKVYQYGDFAGIEIGTINQDDTIPAVIKAEDMLSKHFAIVGSTGTGKSCTVALILRQVLAKHPNAHIVLLDPHNEYGGCFDDKVELVTLNDLILPYWFLSFEEIVETLIGDAVKNVEEVEILRDLIPFAKRQFGANSSRAAALLQKGGVKKARYSVDIPTPYLISDLVALINDQLGRLERQNGIAPLKRLKSRIESISQDPRYEFMFGSLTIHDNMSKVLKRLFRVPVAGKPISVVQLMGLPSEIVNVVVSVLSRLAFEVSMSSEGKVPITFVCEEAHRYVPRDSSTGFEPTKRALSRIAKEGRKYGSSLCIVSQRPGDLDPTILSQCSTVFAMRLSNDRDQAIIQSALSEATASMLDFLSSLGTREAIAFGEGVTLPSRISFMELPQTALPRGGGASVTEAWSKEVSDDGMLDTIVEQWRLSAQEAHEGETIADAFENIGQLPGSDAPYSADRRGPEPGRRSFDQNPLTEMPPPPALTPLRPANKPSLLKPGTDFAKRFGQ